MIWDNPGPNEYPGVRVYAQRVKYAIMSAHDIKEDFGNNSYRLELSRNLKRRGVHDVFHVSLLRIHEPNDDRLFPGRRDSQIAELEEQEEEWAINQIVSHTGAREDAIFEAIWKSGDRTWVPYGSISYLAAVRSYFDMLGIDNMSELQAGTGSPPDDPHVFIGCLMVGGGTHPAKRALPPIPLSSPTPTSIPCNYCSASAHTFTPHEPPMSDTHAYLSRNAALDVILPDEAGVLHSFLNAQAREFVLFNLRLRNHNYDFPTLTMPGGYSQFQTLWSADSDCIYQFSELDPTTGDPIIHGAPISVDEFAPIITGSAKAKTAAKDAVAGTSKDVVEFLLLSQAKRAMHQEEMAQKRKAERLAKKTEKAKARVIFGAGPPPAKRARTDDEDADGEVDDEANAAPVASSSGAGGRNGAMDV
ncbi:hypothetical protein B0H21DRAFT_828544 [Amylocystis lapponica]|nr:hypothetical protein B0H21DRAFT_828544 [Amylocystis lapponica]